jgi:hypothetical protein
MRSGRLADRNTLCGISVATRIGLLSRTIGKGPVFVGTVCLSREHLACAGVEHGYTLTGNLKVSAFAWWNQMQRAEREFEVTHFHWITGRREVNSVRRTVKPCFRGSSYASMEACIAASSRVAMPSLSSTTTARIFWIPLRSTKP